MINTEAPIQPARFAVSPVSPKPRKRKPKSVPPKVIPPKIIRICDEPVIEDTTEIQIPPVTDTTEITVATVLEDIVKVERLSSPLGGATDTASESLVKLEQQIQVEDSTGQVTNAEKSRQMVSQYRIGYISYTSFGTSFIIFV